MIRDCTPVLLANGRVIPIAQIVAGDRLMGPDGKARTVLSTTRGRAQLYRIEPVKGEAWVCHDRHVLTLVNSVTNQIVDIPLDRWHRASKTFKSLHKQFSAGVGAFEEAPNAKARTIDPYFLGVWFGDGTKHLKSMTTGDQLSKVAISKPDRVIRKLCLEEARKWGLHMSVFDEHRCPVYSLAASKAPKGRGRWLPNKLLLALRKLLGRELKIPDAYLLAPRNVRLQFLAGFLDADAELIDNCFSVTQKREDWARALWWVSRSLGFCATIRSRKARYTRVDGSRFEGTYWVVTISGNLDQIPTRIPRKQAGPRRQKKVATRSGFAPIPLGKAIYYSYTLDGDGRFLLCDFTVTASLIPEAIHP